MQRALRPEHTKGAGPLRSCCPGNGSRTMQPPRLARLLCWKERQRCGQSVSEHSFPSWNSLSKATASFFPTLRTAHSQHVKREGKKVEENFKEQNMENTSRDLTLRPVVPRAEEAEGAGGGAGAPVGVQP